MNVEAKRVSEDGLSQHEWRFWVNSDTHIAVSLREYTYSERATTRHKFKAVKHYYRLDMRTANITVEEIPLPDYVQHHVKETISNSITITK